MQKTPTLQYAVTYSSVGAKEVAAVLSATSPQLSTIMFSGKKSILKYYVH